VKRLALIAALFLLALVSCNQNSVTSQADSDPSLQVIHSGASELIGALSADGIEVQWDSARVSQDSNGTRVDLATNNENVTLVGYLGGDQKLAAFFVRVKESEDRVIVGDYVSGFVRGYQVKTDSAVIGLDSGDPSVEPVSFNAQTSVAANALTTIQKRFDAREYPSLGTAQVGDIAPQETCWEFKGRVDNARRARDRSYRAYLGSIARTSAALAAEAFACASLNPIACGVAAVGASAALASQAIARANWLEDKRQYEMLQRAYNASNCTY